MSFQNTENKVIFIHSALTYWPVYRWEGGGKKSKVIFFWSAAGSLPDGRQHFVSPCFHGCARCACVFELSVKFDKFYSVFHKSFEAKGISMCNGVNSLSVHFNSSEL